ncbi:CsbD family protein [Streptomyces sp. NRRL S-920]|uniref:CsbD family protein n=1 Tax=Streptomyces sp. NRRL S-920 TaxID=1463921 RepID=UPI0004C67A3F|nr:CsbD family protein [Streptomyces sp. NRRL S-920]
MGDKGGMDKLKGKAKEMAGKATGDDRREAEGRTDRAKGEAKDAMESARDKAKGMKDSMKRDDS